MKDSLLCCGLHRSQICAFAALLLLPAAICAAQQSGTSGTKPRPATTRSTASRATTGTLPAGPAVATHPHKIYIDTVGDKLWWPMDKPFYVRLTASQDADAPSFLLHQESGSTANNAAIDIPVSGKQYVRWVNPSTNKSVTLVFYTDGVPPVTKSTCTGAPTFTESETTFYGKGLQCALIAQDELSGVESSYLSINGAAYQPYTAAVPLNKEQTVTLHYYSVDHVGYTETPSGTRFIVDLTPPATTDTITGNAIGTTLSSQAKFRIASSDKLSGLANIQTRFDAQEFKPLNGGEISVESLPDGEHTLSYFATDRVSNREKTHNVSFYVDKIPPVASASVVGDEFVSPTGTRFVSSRSQIALKATDNKSGVAKIDYSFGETQFNAYHDAVAIPVKQGAGKVSFHATDKLGNQSTVSSLAYSMDTVAPQTVYHINGPSYQVRSDVYITRATHIDLTATDDASGVLNTQFEPEGEPNQTYTGAFAFPDEGRRLVRFWSTDKVNNRELDRAVLVITDNTPPQIFANFSVAPITTSNAQGMPVYRRLTSLFLGATDNAAGVHKIYYSMDGAKESEYSTPLVLDHIGTFDLLIRVDDNLGNQSSKHIHFVIQ